MSGKDVRRGLLADLRRYLEQRRRDGMEWYLDAGPVTDAVPVTAKPGFTRASTMDAHEPPPLASRGSRSAVRPDADAGTPPHRREVLSKNSFARQCEAFVAETLTLINQARPQVTQQDIFAKQVTKPAPLDPARKEAALRDLAAEVAPCTLCKLHTSRNQTVFGVGHADADLVFIGEAPGRDEDLQGEPFVGRAGQLLTEILGAIGFRREDVYICNILKCRPPQNRDPEREEVDACEPHLKRQLEIIAPKLICCLGRVAAQTLLGTRESLTVLREAVHFYEGIPVLVTFHPAALLRNPHWKRPTWEDVRKLRALYDALQH